MENNTMVVRTERQMTIARVDNGWIVYWSVGDETQVFQTEEELIEAVKYYFVIPN